jgi:hypothetical protein
MRPGPGCLKPSEASTIPKSSLRLSSSRCCRAKIRYQMSKLTEMLFVLTFHLSSREVANSLVSQCRWIFLIATDLVSRLLENRAASTFEWVRFPLASRSFPHSRGTPAAEDNHSPTSYPLPVAKPFDTSSLPFHSQRLRRLYRRTRREALPFCSRRQNPSFRHRPSRNPRTHRLSPLARFDRS